jgi:MFS superfamily sulfate permease-like transporter
VAAGLVRDYLPIVGWLPKYRLASLGFDAVAGLSVWALLVPQRGGLPGPRPPAHQLGLDVLFKAVIAGFVLGFSIGIVIDQSHKLLGVPAPSGSHLRELWCTLKELPETSGTTRSVGAGSLAVLLLMRYVLPK